jgi:hypothetical protein
MLSITGVAHSATNEELEAEVMQLKSDLAEMRAMMQEIRNNQVTKSDVAEMNQKVANVETAQKEIQSNQVTKSDIAVIKRKVAKVENDQKKVKVKPADDSEIAELKQKVEVLEVAKLERENAASSVHLAGYGSVNYINVDNKDEDDRFNDGNRFSNVQFAPIFHYQYKDLLLFEAELDITVDEEGGTEVELEYGSIDVIINDYAALVAGKFLSPLGQFRQNLHPGWINKLPTAPVGYGHDQAAPVANVGVQLRGGFDLSDTKFSYAAYVGNGPKLEESHGGDAPFAVEANGSIDNNNNQLTFGGRIAAYPLKGLETGLSGALGKVAFYDDHEEEFEDNRDYSVLGADFSYHWKNLGLRGEYIEQRVGGLSRSEAETASTSWQAGVIQSESKHSLM